MTSRVFQRIVRRSGACATRPLSNGIGGRGGAAARVVRRATGGEGGGERSSADSGGDDREGGEQKEDQSKSEKKADDEPALYRGIDLKGGKLGYGETVDNALDATTNPDLFIFGAALLTVGAVFAFLFGPRPPSDYYG